MEQWRAELAKYLRQQREAKGLKPKDLVCENLSEPTIRRIERGERVRPESLEAYCKQIGIPYRQVLQMFGQESEESIRQRLEEIDFDIEFRLHIPQSIQDLQEIKDRLGPNHPLIPRIHWMRAKAYFYAGKRDKAEEECLAAIAAAKKHAGYQNIEAMTQIILGLIYFYDRTHPEALAETERGIEKFDRNAEYFDPDRFYMALLNKVAILERMGRIHEAEDILDQLVEESSFIERGVVKANVFEYAAKLKMKNGRYPEALTYALQGLNVTEKHSLYDRAVELWVVVGDIRDKMGQFEEAKRAYNQALKLKKHLLEVQTPKNHTEKKYREAIVATTYAALGKLHGRNGEYETAKSYFEEALKFENDDSRFIDIYQALGELFFNHGKREAAIGPLKQGLELARIKGIVDKEAEIAGLLADCFEGYDQEQHYLYLQIFRKLSRDLKREA